MKTEVEKQRNFQRQLHQNRHLSRQSTLLLYHFLHVYDEKEKNITLPVRSVALQIFKSVANCLKIQQDFIMEITRLYAGTFHPVWLSVLRSLVVTDAVPIKRNQNLVIKALMTHNSILSIITETDSPSKMLILKEGEVTGKHGYDQKHGLCSLVYLISLCAMSENKSIESICQCLLNMDELLGFINMPGLCDGLRLPFLNFLTTGYLHSYSSAARNEIGSFGSDDRMKNFLKSLPGTIQKGMKIIQADIGAAGEMLRQRPANLHRSKSDVVHEKKETLHYIFDGILPVVYAVFEKHWGSGIPSDMELANDILSSLLNFAKVGHSAITRVYQRSQLQKTLRLVSHSSGLPCIVPVELNIRVDVPSESRQKYNVYYNEEQKLNEKFDVFSGNMLAAYEGPNTVRQQLKLPMDSEYCNYLESEALPLGEEFQELVKCFLQKTTPRKKESGNQKKYDITGLVKHLTWTLSFDNYSEQNRLELERLDVKCLQILRAIIHNEFVRLPDNKQENPQLFGKVTKEIQSMQISLDSQGLAPAIMPHLSQSNRTIAHEVFNLLNILYRGNKKTPENFVRYVTDQHEEDFFVAVQDRLLSTASMIKEQRFMLSLHQRNSKESETLMKAGLLRAGAKSRVGTRTPVPKSGGFLRAGIGKSFEGVNQMKNLFLSGKVSPDEEEMELHDYESQGMERVNSATGDGIPLIVTEMEEDRNEPTSPDTMVTISAVEMEQKMMNARSVSAEHRDGEEEAILLEQPDLSVFEDLGEADDGF